LKQVAAASHGDASGASHFQHSKRAQDFEQAVDFVYGAGNFYDQGFWRDVYYAATENFDEFHKVRTGLLVGGYFE